MNDINNQKGTFEAAQSFLDAAYRDLGFQDGDLLMATLVPKVGTQEAEEWLEKGDWLAQASRINAESIFFVDNEPVIVFCQVQDDSAENLLETFRKAWCLSRPQFLFLASPGELKVFSLNQYPAKTAQEWDTITPLEVVRRSAEVSQKLQDYRREQIELRQPFINKNIGNIENRADKRLILDLREIRKLLLATDPRIHQHHIHALIGRSIFVRYLEDRGVLTYEYFRKVAVEKTNPNWSPTWLTILDEPERMDLAPNAIRRYYTRILRDKDFTYALFYQLAEHFNGDMFPQDGNEQNEVTQKHLDLLRKFLLGDTDPTQAKLFLWAYDFEIIPIELISSIYEEFYHKSEDGDSGTHYTPSVLVEYVLSQLLTHRRLATKPKILDLACGSAIFLVHSYKRIVRYKEGFLGRALSNNELQEILSEQITGVEINSEAIYVAAFSLYLALLNYQEPKDILAQIGKKNGGKPLPHIIFDPDHIQDQNYLPVIFHENAFSLIEKERQFIKEHLEVNPRFSNRINYQKLYESSRKLSFTPNSFDIIIGNPPWGYLRRNEGTPELFSAQEYALMWCEVFGWSIGDKELSQAFIARATTLLKPDGDCGLLVSTGVFLKRHRKSQEFRARWLMENTIKTITNFSHVRDIFFSGAISPFCFVHFGLEESNYSHKLNYWSAKRTKSVNQIQSVVLGLSDLHRVRQFELLNNEILWKTYWWGGHHDANLINALSIEETLGDLANNNGWITGQGYTPGLVKQRSWLSNYKELPIELFERFGSIKENDLKDVPLRVHRRGIRELYEGWRLLVKRGITQAKMANGRIEARLESSDYCFRNSIHGISLEKTSDWERKTLVAIIWSSLARYYLFMTTSSWGTWHHEIHLEDGLLRLPIRLPTNHELRDRIVKLVEELSDWNPITQSLLDPNGITDKQISKIRSSLEQQLDNAIFDLYELTESERDLIRDMCDTGLEFFYRGSNSEATSRNVDVPFTQGKISDIRALNTNGIFEYILVFLEKWNRDLEKIGGELYWQITRSPSTPMLAIIFTTAEIGKKTSQDNNNEIHEWNDLLQKLDKTLITPVSPRIYIDGLIRAVSDTNVIIIKRDERRLWTRSQAREDADATLLQAMILQETAPK
jgi:methylase of polypeptide subunit release factors